MLNGQNFHVERWTFSCQTVDIFMLNGRVSSDLVYICLCILSLEVGKVLSDLF